MTDPCGAMLRGIQCCVGQPLQPIPASHCNAHRLKVLTRQVCFFNLVKCIITISYRKYNQVLSCFRQMDGQVGKRFLQRTWLDQLYHVFYRRSYENHGESEQRNPRGKFQSLFGKVKLLDGASHSKECAKSRVHRAWSFVAHPHLKYTYLFFLQVWAAHFLRLI